ncbi:ISL3 family transposase [Belnapia rosea]|uniref:ISL3 family transposase n=1 Tax=Belnapia rosea TaxID=938405 RepID=UPI0038CF7247
MLRVVVPGWGEHIGGTLSSFEVSFLPKRLLPLIPAGLLVQQILHDLPWQGSPVRLHVRALCFRCLQPACPRVTFAERLADTAPPAARRTGRLGDLQRHLGLAAGGEVGARLAARLAMPASADTLLRMVRCADATPEPRPAVRVLAVDEWAWRRGHRYGTVLVDLERNRVVDLLPDRRAESLSAWLRANPGVEIVARDRAGVYADGARQGAPNSVQVADRWHLLRNLGDTVHAVTDRHHAAVQRIGCEIMAQLAAEDARSTPVVARPNLGVRGAEARWARRQARFDEAVRLHAAGASISAISRQVGTDCKTLRHWLQAGAMPTWRRPPRSSLLDPYREHLERRWAAGCCNAARLWRELAALGFPGRPAIVRAWATQRRRAWPSPGRAPVMANGQPWRPPSSRRIARLLMAAASTLSAPDRLFAARLLEEVPVLSAAIAVARRLVQVLRRHSDEALDDVLADAASTPLAAFVTELRKDIAAMRAALDLPWATSPAEGQICRIKMIKRTMYGRAGFELLRARVLYAA